MRKTQSPAGAGAPDGDGNVVVAGSAKQYSPGRRQRQRRPATIRLTLTPHHPGWWQFAIGNIEGGCGQEHLNSQDYFLDLIDVPKMSQGEYIEMVCNAILIGCGHGK
jgi:hypothetical protein